MKQALLIVAAVCAALAVGVGTAPAGGGNSANAQKCQQGGYLNYSTTAGTLFKNVGACVSYAAQGGTLVPLPDLVLGVSCTPSATGTECVFTVTNQGIGPVSGKIDLQATLHSTNPLGVVSAEATAGPCTATATTAEVTLTDASATASCTGSFAPGTTLLPLAVAVAGSDAPSGTTITVNGAVDPNNLILESNEGNNTFSQTSSF